MLLNVGLRTGDKAPMAYVELVDRPVADFDDDGYVDQAEELVAEAIVEEIAEAVVEEAVEETAEEVVEDTTVEITEVSRRAC